jgi:hypothetical protein
MISIFCIFSFPVSFPVLLLEEDLLSICPVARVGLAKCLGVLGGSPAPAASACPFSIGLLRFLLLLSLPIHTRHPFDLLEFQELSEFQYSVFYKDLKSPGARFTNV